MTTAYEKIYKMNSLIGHRGGQPNTSEFWSQIRNQTERVVEEVNETLDAAIDEDTVGMLDGMSDILVTAIGLYQKLAQFGYPVEEALERVCDNNLTKFHETAEEANETVQFYRDFIVETFVRMVTLNNGEVYYSVIRKSDGKLLKPKYYQSVDLSDLANQVEKIAKEWGSEHGVE